MLYSCSTPIIKPLPRYVCQSSSPFHKKNINTVAQITTQGVKQINTKQEETISRREDDDDMCFKPPISIYYIIKNKTAKLKPIKSPVKYLPIYTPRSIPYSKYQTSPQASLYHPSYTITRSFIKRRTQQQPQPWPGWRQAWHQLRWGQPTQQAQWR